MEITYFIGNGFDLQAGLKTSYGDFYDYIFDLKMNKKDSGFRNTIYENINREIDKWSDFEQTLGAFTHELKKEEVKSFIKDLNEVRKDFQSYVINQDDIFDLDKELTKKLFTNTLIHYYSELPLEEKEIFSSFHKTNNSQNIYYNFMIFNFTSSFERSLESFPDKLVAKRGSYKNVINNYLPIHGTTHESMLLGVNDDSQINKDIFSVDQRKALIKPEANNGLKNGVITRAEKILNSSSIVVIFGMSLGQTDKIWWEKINNWLSKSISRKLIIHQYTNEFDNIDLFAIFENETWIKKSFLEFSDLNDSKKEQLMKQIFIIKNSSISFKVSLIQNENSCSEKVNTV